MSENLPPKTCTIDRLVTVKEDVQKVLDGKKRSNRRNGRYADIDEIMELSGRKFKVTNVYQQALGEMTESDYENEGFEGLESYKEYILSLHPGMPWIPKAKVWVHEFEEL